MYSIGKVLLTSTSSYILKYAANNVITFFENDHDEFYWNVNGTDWAIPIKKVSATIHLPVSLTGKELRTECFTGTYGESGKDCEISILDSRTIEFASTKPFDPYKNLTIVIGMPYGTIQQPSILEKILRTIMENWGLAFALLTLIVMFLIWRKFGRDDQTVSNTIMPHYTPPEDILPTETGTIIDEKLDIKDITAIIIDYAVRGFIKITEVEEKSFVFTSKDYELELLKPYITKKDFEKMILDAIFKTNETGSKIRISQLENKFYVHIPKIDKSVMARLVKDGYFPYNPSTIRTIYRSIGIVLIMIIVFAGEILVEFLGISVASMIGIGLAGLIIIIFGQKMPHKTKKGTETYYKLKGLYEYIDTAEKDRMKFQEDNNILFEKLLPYAMAFGLITKWTKAFNGLIKEQPGWYHSKGAWGSDGFTMMYFADRMNSLNSKMESNMTSRPGGKGGKGGWGGGSGFGGGFSGGGFGGGGGRGL